MFSIILNGLYASQAQVLTFPLVLPPYYWSQEKALHELVVGMLIAVLSEQNNKALKCKSFKVKVTK